METLETLNQYTAEELGGLYRDGTVPEPDIADGDFRGDVPAVENNLYGLLTSPTRILSKSGLLPWRGKSFDTRENTTNGVNRLFFDWLQILPFEARENKSLFDDKPCLLLDYSLDVNPLPAHFIRDEVRQINKRVLLGQMYFKPTSDLVLYFSLEKQ